MFCFKIKRVNKMTDAAVVVDRGPNRIEWEKQAILAEKSNLNTDATSAILDEQWAKFAFLVNADDLAANDVANRGFSSAYFKFTDTSLGGAMCINPKPQFTRYADAREPGRMAERIENTVGNFAGKVGMGRYYSEAIDDTSQIVHMRFGVPQFNSLTTFFTGFYNSSAARLAKTGRGDKFFNNIAFTIGQGVGAVFGLVLWPVLLINLAGNLARYFFNKPSSKFYYLKPTMLTYWSAVNTMVNRIGVGRGLLPNFQKDNPDQRIGDQQTNNEALLFLHQLMPDVFSETGAYDIYAVANKAQRMSNRLQQDDESNFSGTSYTNFKGYVQRTGQTKLTKPLDKPSLLKSIGLWLLAEITSPEATSENSEASIKINPKDTKQKAATPTRSFEYFKSEMDDGSAFANFRVDYTGPVQESFSNTVGESDLAGKINSITSQSRAASFSFAGGNIVGGALGTLVGGALDAAKSFATGITDSLGVSGLVGLAGAAFVDIPKNWQSSSASLPRSTYTMQLTSPYGNTVSQMNNLYIPLCMILAGALPLSTGKQSYTSPFICEIYDKGRCQTRLGMIDSVSVTRGTGNLGFNKLGHAMGIDITFTVVDMSTVMHMPISKGFDGDSDGIFDDETVYSDYMAVLASQDLHSQFYKLPKLKLALARQVRQVEALTSPSMWAMVVHDKTPVGIMDVFFKGNNTIF